MNWYVYTGNDPVNYVDPWGLSAEDGLRQTTVRLTVSGREPLIYHRQRISQRIGLKVPSASPPPPLTPFTPFTNC